MDETSVPAESDPSDWITSAGLIVCLLGSGAAALIYETVWARQLSYAFSSTPVTACLVLSSFMGGMALGSALAGRMARQLRAPLIAYALLELGLAACGLAFPALIDRVGSLYIDLARRMGGGPGLGALEFAMFSALLAIPSVLMGATLPILLEARPLGWRRAGGRTALLYAVNAAGGVLGCLLAGFVMIEHLGLTHTSRVGAVANMLAAGVSFVLAALVPLRVRAAPPVAPVAPEEAAAAPGSPAPAPSIPAPAIPAPRSAVPAMPAVSFALFVSGATAMAYELLWSRTLPLVLGSSTYSFALMLATFVAGIALGSLTYALAGQRLGDPLRVVGWSQAGIGIWVLSTLPLYGLLRYPLLAIRLVAGMTFGAYQAGAVVLTASTMLVPALLFGLGFPAAIQGGIGPAGAASRVVGRLYAFNTAGNLLGSLITGLVLVPLVGTPLMFQICALANLACAAIFLRPWRAPPYPVMRTALALIAILILVAPPGTRQWHDRIAIGAVSRQRPSSWKDLEDSIAKSDGFKRLMFEEDRALTVAVTSSEKTGRSLWVNGKVDASDVADMISQVMAGQLAPLMHPAPKKVFVLGLGSGVTAGTVLTHPVESVDCVEISRAVTHAAEQFVHVNRAPWTDKRFRLHVDDGRHWLQLAERKFDVIIVEPSNPWMAGMANIFTREFLEQVRGHLEPGGLVMQWTHLYEIDQGSLDQIVRTFQSVFPHVRAFYLHRTLDLLMVGSPEAGPLEARRVARIMAERMRRPEVAGELHRVGVLSPFSLLATELFSGQMLAHYAGPGPLLVDDQPRLEFTAPRGYYTAHEIAPPYMLLPLRDSLLAAYLDGRAPTADELYDYARVRLLERHLVGLTRLITGPGAPRDPRLSWVAARAFLQQQQPFAALPLAREAYEAAPRDVERVQTWYLAARGTESQEFALLAPMVATESRRALAVLRELEPGNIRHRLDAAELAMGARDLDTAVRELEGVMPQLALIPAEARTAISALWIRLAERLTLDGRTEHSLAAARRALAADSENSEARAFFSVRSPEQ